MTMTRRLFARALGAAPIAAQALAKMGAGKDTLLSGPSYPSSLPPVGYSSPSYDTPDYFKENIASLTRRLLAGLNEDELRECRLQAMSRLDPDLASMRSFSASALIAMQFERNKERQLAARNRWLTSDIEGYKKQLAKVFS